MQAQIQGSVKSGMGRGHKDKVAFAPLVENLELTQSVEGVEPWASWILSACDCGIHQAGAESTKPSSVDC